MAWENLTFIALNDLYVAYRKAKVDMFYERDHATAIAFADYEEKLDDYLQALLAELNSPQPNWQSSSDFVGTYGFLPKALDFGKDRKEPPLQFVTSLPDASWRIESESSNKRPTAKFRIVGRHPVHFHVLSALWLQKVGYLYDGVLGDCAYGSRMRRAATKDGKLIRPSATSLGTFRPYSYGFRAWRQNGLDAIRVALDKDKSVIAVTADLRSFYHEVSPRYLLDSQFLEEFGVDLNPDQHRFTEQLIAAMRTWAINTPNHKEFPDRGIPVGLSAPRVIANALLAGFDRAVLKRLNPLYYGRYVDDVLLVLDNQSGLASAADAWVFIANRLEGMLVIGKDGDEDAFWLNLKYAKDSRLRFAGEKQKVFALSGSSGKSLLDSISQTITQKSSDWRLLPDLPGDANDLSNDFVTAGEDAKEEVDNLRKSDGLSIRRLAFAIRLRNFESVERDIRPEQWRTHREKFYRLAMDHVVTVPGLFAYGPYLSRLVGLAVACGDWTDATAFVERIRQVFQTLSQTTDHKSEEIYGALESMLASSFEACVKALALKGVDLLALGDLLKAFDEDFVFFPPTADKSVEIAVRLYAADLARNAFREPWLDGEGELLPKTKKEWSIHLPPDMQATLRLKDAVPFLKSIGLQTGRGIPRAIAFPTRPFSPAEITLLDPQSLTDGTRLRKMVRALRGSEIPQGSSLQHRVRRNNGDEVIDIPIRTKQKTTYVAVPCFKTQDKSWVASVSGTADPDHDRYFRLNKLINDLLLERIGIERSRVQYVVLPELSLPRRWFNRIAHKLSHSGVSLIAGLEYLHYSPAKKAALKGFGGTVKGYVANQVRASLVTDVLGYPSHVIYAQEKWRPALDEEEKLRKIAGKLMVPKGKVAHPVIRHGRLHFGILICSELTNIDLRKPFRGHVDALFVPEWNRDVNSFNSLVEASALDIHCFVVQVNNRTYGDCRIRAPYREPYERDVARVVGGETDYFVVGKIDIDGLRAFQSNFKSPTDGLFKPTPDGFEISPDRKVMPTP